MKEQGYGITVLDRSDRAELNNGMRFYAQIKGPYPVSDIAADGFGVTAREAIANAATQLPDAS